MEEGNVKDDKVGAGAKQLKANTADSKLLGSEIEMVDSPKTPPVIPGRTFKPSAQRESKPKQGATPETLYESTA